MTKRKRAPKPAPDESTDDAAPKDDMVHVTSDLLAGGPDIFAARKSEPEPAIAAAEPELEPEPAASAFESEAAEPPEQATEPTEASTTLAPEEPLPSTSEPHPPPASPYATAAPCAPPRPPGLAGRQPLLELVAGHLVVAALAVGPEAHRAVDLEHRGVRPRVVGRHPLEVGIELAKVPQHRRLDPLAEAAATCIGAHAGELLVDDRSVIGRPHRVGDA